MKKNILVMNDPRELFTTVSESEYKKLLFVYHPDYGGTSDEIIKLNELYETAKILLSEDRWDEEPNTEIFKIDNKKVKIRYYEKRTFEIGAYYICRNLVVYLVNNQVLAQNAKTILTSLNYADIEMEKKFKKIIPFYKSYEIKEGTLFLFYRNNTIQLKDMLTYFNNEIHPKTVTWILSRLYDICCFNYYNKIAHNNLSLDSIFVSPEYHTASLIGGWWYARTINSNLIALPKRTIEIINPKDTTSLYKDIKLVNNLGLTLIGKYKSTIPKELYNWLITSTEMNPFELINNWQQIIINAFGKKEFFKCECLFKYGE